MSTPPPPPPGFLVTFIVLLPFSSSISSQEYSILYDPTPCTPSTPLSSHSCPPLCSGATRESSASYLSFILARFSLGVVPLEGVLLRDGFLFSQQLHGKCNQSDNQNSLKPTRNAMIYEDQYDFFLRKNKQFQNQANNQRQEQNNKP